MKPAGLVIAMYPHYTSRNLDPQVHIHCLVANIGVGQNQRTNSLYSPALYRHKMEGGALFRWELANRCVHDLGLSIQSREGGFWEIQGVPKPLMDAFSTRRQQIEVALEKRGVYSARAAAIATLDTRVPKQEMEGEILSTAWLGIAESYDFGRPEIATLLATRAPERNIPSYADLERRVYALLGERMEEDIHNILAVLRQETLGLGMEYTKIEEFAQSILDSWSLLEPSPELERFRTHRLSTQLQQETLEQEWGIGY